MHGEVFLMRASLKMAKTRGVFPFVSQPLYWGNNSQPSRRLVRHDCQQSLEQLTRSGGFAVSGVGAGWSIGRAHAVSGLRGKRAERTAKSEVAVAAGMSSMPGRRQ